MFRHASLFSGIGGFDLAAEWMEWENVFHCEINPFCNKILNYYWPNAKTYKDIKQTNFLIHRGQIDVLTGGFPCQPYSLAGKRLGKDDERHLWPYFLRAIRKIRPTWVVGENVFGIVGWNGGLVFEEVQADLEASGYEVQTFVLPACAVDAPHRRDRVWFVAHPNNQGLQRIQNRGSLMGGRKKQNEFSARRILTNWENFPTQSPICSGDDGISSKLDGIAFPKWRNESIKGYGNAIVPQIALQIFKAIEKYEKIKTNQ